LKKSAFGILGRSGRIGWTIDLWIKPGFGVFVRSQKKLIVLINSAKGEKYRYETPPLGCSYNLSLLEALLSEVYLLTSHMMFKGRFLVDRPVCFCFLRRREVQQAEGENI
jgi:hypothetical protein